MPRASATAQAWRGPAPPKATRARPDGSTPRSTVTARTARSMAASTTATTPSAVDAGAVERGPGGVDVEPAEVAEGGVDRDAAEDEVGVGDGRPPPAPSVAGRSRVGAGALRSHDEGAARVDGGDRTPAGADGVDVEGGQAHREAGRHPARRRLGHASLDEADVGARPAHVEGDGVGEAGRRGRGRAGHHAARRSRQEEGDGELGRLRRRHQPAGRGHDQDLVGQAVELAEVVAAPRAGGRR